jgi:hypothetical protein
MNKKDFEVLAFRELLLHSKSTGTNENIKITLGKPYWVEEGISAACPLVIDGLIGRLPDIVGIDFMQALQLALSMSENILNSVNGEKSVLWLDGEPYSDEFDAN